MLTIFSSLWQRGVSWRLSSACVGRWFLEVFLTMCFTQDAALLNLAVEPLEQTIEALVFADHYFGRIKSFSLSTCVVL